MLLIIHLLVKNRALCKSAVAAGTPPESNDSVGRSYDNARYRNVTKSSKSYALDFEHMKIARTIRGLGGDPEKLAWCDTTWHSNGSNFVDCGSAQSTWVISLGKVADKAHTQTCTPLPHRLLQSRPGLRGITSRPTLLCCNDSLEDVITAPQGT